MSSGDQIFARPFCGAQRRHRKAALLSGARGDCAAGGGWRAELSQLARREPPAWRSGVKRIAALIFDMDGVLVDSNPMHRAAWEKFNLGYGLVTTEAMQRQMYGRRNDQIVRDFFGDSLSDEEIASRGRAKEKLYREMIASEIEKMIVLGLREFLLQYHRLPMAIA